MNNHPSFFYIKNTAYYIEFKFLIVLIKHLKQELVFHIYDYENLDNEKLYREIISVIVSIGNLSISYSSI
jgi:hypothetical protein